MYSDTSEYQAMPPSKNKSTVSPEQIKRTFSINKSASDNNNEIIPFEMKKSDYKKLTKLPSLEAWTIKKDTRRNILVVDYWIKQNTNKIKNYLSISGKQSSDDKLEQNSIDIIDTHYDSHVDSWIVKDTEGNFYRLSWENVYTTSSNVKYHIYRESVNQIIFSCT